VFLDDETGSRATLNSYNGLPDVAWFLEVRLSLRPSAFLWSCTSSTALAILRRSLLIRGFINSEFVSEHYGEFLQEIGPLVAKGRIRYREHIVEGLEAAPSAFIGMLEGRNFGKLIVKVA
jgi:NADPH:quinone reductase-like Zn-dependent oxidoreductase